MSLTLEINGVDRTSNWWYPKEGLGDGGAFSRRVGGQGPATFVLYDTVGASGYRPTTGQSATLKSSGTPVYAGIITDVEENGLGELDRGVRTTITVVDQQSLAARANFTQTYAAGAISLKGILQDLVAGPLAAFSVTLDAAQATGSSSFGELVYTDAKVIDVLNQLQALTGWVWRIDASKVLRMIAPASESSGYTFSDSNAGGAVQGTVSLRKSRSTSYCNKVIVTCGPSGVFAIPRTESVTANGTASSWTFDVADNTFGTNVPYTSAGGGGTIDVGGVIRNSAVGEFTWTLDPSTATATLALLTGTPTAGTVITFQRNIQPPFSVMRQDATKVAAEGPWPARYTDQNITDVDTGVAFAAALLARDKSEPWLVTVRALDALVWPGQSISLSFSERAISGTYMVLSADFVTTEDGRVQATIECLSGSSLQADWLDYFKTVASGVSSGSTTISGTVTSTTLTTLTAPVSLGGARDRSIAANPAAWKPAVDYQRFVAAGDFTARLRVDIWTRNAGIAVQARLYDETAAAAVAGMTTSIVTSTTPASQAVVGNLFLGHSYRLEVLNSTNGEGVFAIGTLEAT